jgi:hypothetical protein
MLAMSSVFIKNIRGSGIYSRVGMKVKDRVRLINIYFSNLEDETFFTNNSLYAKLYS